MVCAASLLHLMSFTLVCSPSFFHTEYWIGIWNIFLEKRWLASAALKKIRDIFHGFSYATSSLNCLGFRARTWRFPDWAWPWEKLFDRWCISLLYSCCAASRQWRTKVRLHFMSLLQGVGCCHWRNAFSLNSLFVLCWFCFYLQLYNRLLTTNINVPARETVCSASNSLRPLRKHT